MLQGESSLKCGVDGQWSDAWPTCMKTCLALAPPANGSCSPKSCSGIVGDQITFTCNDGYMLHGSNKLSCLKEGTWSDPAPTCKGE